VQVTKKLNSLRRCWFSDKHGRWPHQQLKLSILPVVVGEAKHRASRNTNNGGDPRQLHRQALKLILILTPLHSST